MDAYEVTWRPHPNDPGLVLAEILAFGVNVSGGSREQLTEQVMLAIKARGGDPARGIRWRKRRA